PRRVKFRRLPDRILLALAAPLLTLFAVPALPATPSILLLNVAMHDLRRQSSLFQVSRNGLRQHHGTMLSARATNGNRQITLPLWNVRRNEIRKQSFEPPQKLTRLRKRIDVPLHLLVLPGELPKLRNKMRVRQKPHVKNQIRVRRNSKFVPETHDG